MAVTEVLEALGSFEIELREDIPRDIVDVVDYFGHIAIIPGRMNPVEYGDNTLTAARYVGVIRRKKLADDGRTNLIMDDTRIGGVGMNFWLGDEDNKGAVLETPLSFTNASFSSVITALCPSSVSVGTIYSVPGSYSGRHVYEAPRTSIQYVCDTMSSAGLALYDTFNRGNTTTNLGQLDSGQLWTQNTGTWGIISNAGYISASGVNSIASIPVAASFDAQITVQTISAGKAYFLFRMADTANYWRFGSSTATGAIVLSRVIAGVATPVVTLTNTMANSTTLRVVASADIIYLYVNGVLVGQTTDSFNDTNVNLGMNCDDITTRWETFNAAPANSPTSFRVNNDATLDAGPESSLYVTNPTCIILRKGTSFGEDMTLRALPTQLDLDQDMEDFSTRTLMLAEANGESVATGFADIASVAPGVNIYKDIHGNPIKLTRMVSESDTLEQNAAVRAELSLRQVLSQKRNLTLSTEDYDIYGSFKVGDYVYLYDPDAGLTDLRNEVTIRGARVNPIKLQVTETDWPITNQYSVGYRSSDGTWYDITDYIHFDEPVPSKVVIGDFQRQLNNAGQSVASRVGSLTQADNTIPAAPAWVTASFQTTVYLDGIGNSKAQQKLVWSTPLNVDGTTILDGDRYEIQYRLNTGQLFSQTWGGASTLRWNQMNTWGQPVAADSSQWQSAFFQWGTNIAVIQDLASGTVYDFRVRAIDSGNNTSAWSSNTTNTQALDSIPPSTPEPPTVAGSTIAIQVTHFLGKATGGVYNLENDLAYLEVHAQYEPLFTPDNTTKLGNLRANRGMMAANTPAIQTYPITQTVPVYIKVVAVDNSGNRSSPSAPAVVTANLIDDQYISNLSVSKLTAGSILADWVLAGSIKTATTGQRLEIDQSGIRFYDPNNLNTFTGSTADGSVSMTGQAQSSNYLEGVAGWHIGADGSTQFDSVNTLNDVSGTNGRFDNVYMDGVMLPSVTDLNAYYQTPKPMVKVNRSTAFSTSATSSTWTIIAWDSLEHHVNTDASAMWDATAPSDLVAPISGLYTVGLHLQWTSVGSDHSPVVIARINAAGDGTSGGIRLFESYESANSGQRCSTAASINVYLNAGDVIEIFARSDGASTALNASSTGTAFCQLEYVSAFATGTIALGSSPSIIQSYTSIGTWSRTYVQGGSQRPSGSGTVCYQGQYDSLYGLQHSAVGFNYANIQSALAGKTITGVTLQYKVKHAYSDSLTAVIGTHNESGIPSSYPSGTDHVDRVEKSSSKIGATYVVSLAGAGIGSEFRDDTSKGIIFGSVGNSSDLHSYYGYHYGDPNQTSTMPRLVFYYY